MRRSGRPRSDRSPLPTEYPVGISASRSLFLRGLGVVYLIAFLSLEWQVIGLFGTDGLIPIGPSLERAGGALEGLRALRLPTLFWLDASDAALTAACWVGAAAALVLISGTLPQASLVVLWLLYLSFVSVGAPFLSYQWDTLLLEVGFLAIFWAPSSARLASSRATRPSPFLLWCFRWLLFRLMFFSGWVKLASGDPTWWDLTALLHHYETQPLPTWTSWYMDQLPLSFQKISTAGSLALELVLPFLIFFGRRARAIAAAAFLGLQLFIGATGNYGFFNLLSALLCVPLLDDAQLFSLVPARLRPRATATNLPTGAGRNAIDVLVTLLILGLTVPQAIDRLRGVRGALSESIAPLQDLARPFHLTGRYGLFAVMTRTRPEVIIEGSRDGVHWTPYLFRWKPGPLERRPVFVEPDMPRLDWQMWFDSLYLERSLTTGRRATRVITPLLLEKLRQGSPAVLDLLGSDPFGGHPPRHLRWQLYEYQFTNTTERETTGNWWKRRPLPGPRGAGAPS